METIKLNKKKKKILWKRVAIIICIIALIAGMVFLNANLRTSYKYYSIDTDRNRIEIGISKNNDLKNDVMYSYLHNLREQGYEVSDFNMDTIIERQKIITWGDPTYNDDAIIEDIEQAITVKVYAYKLEFNDNIYYLPQDKAHSIVEKLGIETELKGEFVNLKMLLNDNQLENFINENKVD